MSNGNPIEDTEITIDTDLGVMEPWFSFQPGKQFTMPKGQQRFIVKMTVVVPEDAKLQEYEGVVRFRASDKEVVPTGVSIVKGVIMVTKIKVTNTTVKRLVIETINIPTVIAGNPIKLEIKARNEGNITAAPQKVILKVLSRKDESLLETLEFSDLLEITPWKSGQMVAEFPTKLGLGAYIGKVEIYLDDETVLKEDRIIFDIVEEKKPVEKQQAVAEVTKTSALPVAFSAITSQPGQIMLGLGVLMAVALLTVVIIRRQKAKKIQDRQSTPASVSGKAPVSVKTTKRKHHKALFPVFLLFITGLWAGTYAAKLYIIDGSALSLVTPAPRQQAEKPTALAQTAQPNQEQQVLGETTGQPLTVSKAQTPEYLVYEEPNTDSVVIYTAQEGDEFSVVAYKDKWYQVKLDNGETGWLQSTSIKSGK